MLIKMMTMSSEIVVCCLYLHVGFPSWSFPNIGTWNVTILHPQSVKEECDQDILNLELRDYDIWMPDSFSFSFVKV